MDESGRLRIDQRRNGRDSSEEITEEEQKFFDHAEDLLQEYAEVQESVKGHMKSFASAAMHELPTPNMDLLGSSLDHSAFAPS